MGNSIQNIIQVFCVFYLHIIIKHELSTENMLYSLKKSVVFTPLYSGVRDFHEKRHQFDINDIHLIILTYSRVTNTLESFVGTISCTNCGMASEKTGLLRHSSWNLFMAWHIIYRVGSNECLDHGLFESFS